MKLSQLLRYLCIMYHVVCCVYDINDVCCCVYWPCCCWLCGQCGRCLVPRPGARCLCGRGGGGRSDTVQAAELGIMMLARHRVNVSITSPTPTHHPRSHDGRSIRNDGCCQPDMQARFNNHWCNNQRRHLLTCLHLLFFVEYTSQRPWVRFWGAKNVPSSCMYLRLACVIKVIIIDI